MKIHRPFFIPLFLLFAFNITAQDKNKINSAKDMGFTAFSIKGTLDSINFIVSDTSLIIKKPIFLFCQGSLPYALFYKEDSIHTYQQSIPLDFIQNGKTNLTLKPYLECDHNFTKIIYGENGKMISREDLWDKVADDFFIWVK